MRGASQGAKRAHGSLRPAADQRYYARFHLRADRHRLHDGLRHHRHGELRARRRVHGLGVHRPDHAPDPDHLARHRISRACVVHRADRRHGLHLAGQLGDRTRRLPAAARFVPACAADLGDRHVDLSVQLRAGDAGSAQQGDRTAAARRDRAGAGRLRRHHLVPAAHHLGDHRRAARGLLVSGEQDLARPRAARLRAGSADGGPGRRRRRPHHFDHLHHRCGARRRRGHHVPDVLRRRELLGRFRARDQGFHRGGARRHRLASGRGGRRNPHRPDRNVVVGLLLDRLQGCRRLRGPRHHADLPAARAARPARSREGVMAVAAPDTAVHHAAVRPNFPRAFKDAAITAAISFALLLPLIGFKTVQNMRNELELETRFPLLLTIVAIITVARLFGLLVIEPWRERRALHPPAPNATLTAAKSAFANYFTPFAMGFVVVYLILVLLLVPQGALKWIDNFGIQILIYVMLGWGLNIVVGLAGLLDLGYVAFYAVGAYSYSLLAKEFGFSFWILLPLPGCLSAFRGILLGFPVLYLRGDYLAIVTLAFGEIIRLILINWVSFTHGYAGITGIPRPTFLGIPFNANDDGFAAVFGLEFSPLHRTIFLYYVILALALLTAFVTVRLRRLPVGRAWEALREDEIACRALGINTTNTKLTAFAMGAMFGGCAGSFFAARKGFISPESFTFLESATILAIVVLGGMGSQIGVAIAAMVMIGGTEIMRELDFLKVIFGNDFDPTQNRMLIFGLGMVSIMVWRARGVIATGA